MDTLSHALIGVAVAGLSGHAPAITDPLYIATVLGAQAPDFDIIAQVRGNYNYLKQHRFYSHSVPGVAGWSSLIGLAVSLFCPDTSFLTMMLWAFAGGLSHIIIDCFNTHGAAVLWPFRKKRVSCNLLNVFDPVLFVLMLSIYLFKLPMQQVSLLSFSSIIIYLAFRYYLRQRSAAWLRRELAEGKLDRLLIMPSLQRIFFWDFVVETNAKFMIGDIGALFPVISIKAEMPKRSVSHRTRLAKHTRIGRFFRKFTPFSYFEERVEANRATVDIYDLRYYNNKFIHSATIVFDDDNQPCESYIESLGQVKRIPC